MHLFAFCIIRQSDFTRNLQKSHAPSHLPVKSAGFLIHLGSLTKIPANTLKSFNLFLGIANTCKFEQTQNFLNDSSLSTGNSKNWAPIAGEKLRVPPSVLGATWKSGQSETRDKLILERGL